MTGFMFRLVFLTTCFCWPGCSGALLSRSVNFFSQQLYQQIGPNISNVIYSPFSIHQALTIAYTGANGQTATEFSQTLGLSSIGGVQSINTAYKRVIEQLNNATDVDILTANGLFLNPQFTIKSQFVNQASQFYLAQVSNFNLTATGGPEVAINNFVEVKTRNQIRDLLPSGTITSDTILVIVNTLFFNGTWQRTFSKSATSKQNFYTDKGANIQVDTMQDLRTINIKKNFYNADIAELKFKGGRFSLFIALPRSRNGVAALERSLATRGRVEQLFSGLTQAIVNISLPRFKIESSFVLRQSLRNLGIVRAFDRGLADLSGISSNGRLYIDEVLHKAVIDVNEDGTVAAAATAIIISTTSLILPEFEFHADHPFLAFLVDTQLKLILFQTKYSG